MRTLILIPIIHTEHDLGSLLEKTKEQYVARYDLAKWTQHLEAIDGFWDGVHAVITALELPYASVRLYQDGLPVCGKEVEIVEDVAAQGSKNHQLLVQLMSQGCQLMGTEDSGLLLQEYRLHQAALGLGDPDSVPTGQGANLLADRDKFIAARIDATLAVGEIGLLFLGMAHDVAPLLPANVFVRHLLPSLK
jgi:hypothetical protein